MIISDIHFGSYRGQSEMCIMRLLSAVLKSEHFIKNLFICFYCLDQKQRSLANQKVCDSFCVINYNDHPNQNDKLFQSFGCYSALCFGVCFRLQEVSGKCQQWTSGEFCSDHSFLVKAALTLPSLCHLQSGYDETYSIVNYECNTGELLFSFWM